MTADATDEKAIMRQLIRDRLLKRSSQNRTATNSNMTEQTQKPHTMQHSRQQTSQNLHADNIEVSVNQQIIVQAATEEQFTNYEDEGTRLAEGSVDSQMNRFTPDETPDETLVNQTVDQSEINLRALMQMEDDATISNINPLPNQSVNQTIDDSNFVGDANGATEAEQPHSKTMIMTGCSKTQMEGVFDQTSNSFIIHSQQLHTSAGGNRTPNLKNRCATSNILMQNSSSHERTQDLIQKKLGAAGSRNVPPILNKQQSSGSNSHRNGTTSARLKFITQGQTPQLAQTARNLAIGSGSNQAIPGRIMSLNTPQKQLEKASKKGLQNFKNRFMQNTQNIALNTASCAIESDQYQNQ